jgi:hypothetical protein
METAQKFGRGRIVDGKAKVCVIDPSSPIFSGVELP